MHKYIRSASKTRLSRATSALIFFFTAIAISVLVFWNTSPSPNDLMTDEQIMTRFLFFPAVIAFGAYFATGLISQTSASPATLAAPPSKPQAAPFKAQIVGLQWLNPLQRRDYSTEWQLLWTLGVARPNIDDDMVKAEPAIFSKLQAISNIASSNKGTETFRGYHKKYINELLVRFHDIYFQSPTYFYNAHSLKDRTTWRELAGIHVEYAIPYGRLDASEAAEHVKNHIRRIFQIGNPNTPEAWSRSTPPDVRVIAGGPNAGFTSLDGGLRYLEAHPDETVWVMNWDAPSYPPKDKQINENIVLLVLAGPSYKTERAPLAWIGYPATRKTADFEAVKGKPSRVVQAWKAAIEAAATNAGKQDTDIGYVIHDANNKHAESPNRIASLAQTLTTELVEFDFAKQTFNTPALLGEMGAGTALTNVALGIAYANHIGKNVLVAGTTDAAQPTAVVVVPPEKVRPFNPDGPWFRARGGNAAFLPWWGLRHDAEPGPQGYSR
ncbi:virulence factor [Pseudoduganella chitinolytica]|uniref:Virulence factor n=1 Tax=Pseudoduganella chitinolytica TaxID=34070 RepID=A0ABY8BH95_9BURK|nr:virulence factor [Pseudoduganella chitinolytica]WEF35292.1 virulence factor [Pseudoduganella chitinolytica]